MHYHLGRFLRAKGDIDGAIGSAARLKPDDASNRRGLTATERLKALRPQLPALLDGMQEPGSAADAAALATLAETQGRHAAAVRLYAAAFDADPKLAEDQDASHRYDAASSAALAGSGHGRDAPPADVDRAGLRRQALAWLEADLVARAERLRLASPKDAVESRNELVKWRYDLDLAPIREAAFLDKLPEAERAQWRAFWAEVNRVLRAEPAARP